MADDKPTSDGGNPTGDGTGGASPNAGVTFTPEQQAHIDALVTDRLKRAQAKWEAGQQTAAEKAKAEADAATLAEQKRFQELAEKTAKERDAAIAERDAERAQVKQHRLREAFRTTAATLKLKWATDAASADAFALVANQLTDFTVKEDGTADGMDNVLKALQTSRPYLFAKAEAASANVNAADGRGGGAPPDPKAHEAELRQRFHIRG